jgi:polysaccharide biosynthesis/export protein
MNMFAANASRRIVSMSLRRAVPLALWLAFSASWLEGMSRADDPPSNPARQLPRRPVRRVAPRKAQVKAAEPAKPAATQSLDLAFPILNLPAPDSIKPEPEVAIPDNPPPHEGAMFDLPLVIEPPDLLLVEVLEALPGMPISGERLVRPNGTINLGFYGDLHVRGLAPAQAKEKIVLHLRRWLPDEVLGLNEIDPVNEKRIAIAPQNSNRVVVDITAFNSKFYYVHGEVATPGRLPHTGNETVLDVVQYAGGLLRSSDPKNIKLIRPARGGKPTRTLMVDLMAIQEGDTTKNYQIFPGDRLIFGRQEHVYATARQDGRATTFVTMAGVLRQALATAREIVAATPDLKAPERDELVRDLLATLGKSGQVPDGPGADEATFRELVRKAVKASSKPLDAEKAETPKP